MCLCRGRRKVIMETAKTITIVILCILVWVLGAMNIDNVEYKKEYKDIITRYQKVTDDLTAKLSTANDSILSYEELLATCGQFDEVVGLAKQAVGQRDHVQGQFIEMGDLLEAGGVMSIHEFSYDPNTVERFKETGE